MKQVNLIGLNLVLMLATLAADAYDPYLHRRDRQAVAERVIFNRRTSCMMCGNSVMCGDRFSNVNNSQNVKSYCEQQNQRVNHSFDGNMARYFGADGNKPMSYSRFTNVFRSKRAGVKQAMRDNGFKLVYLRDKRNFERRMGRFEFEGNGLTSYEEYLNLLSVNTLDGNLPPAPTAVDDALAAAQTSPVVISPPVSATETPDDSSATDVGSDSDNVPSEPVVTRPRPNPQPPRPANTLDCDRDWYKPECDDRRPARFTGANCEQMESYNTRRTTYYYENCSAVFNGLTSLEDCRSRSSNYLRSQNIGSNRPRRRRDRASMADINSASAILGNQSSNPYQFVGFNTDNFRPNVESLNEFRERLSGFHRNLNDRCNNSSSSGGEGSQ